MAYTSSYEICNLALAKIGQPAITSAEFTTPGTKPSALACVALYEPERDMLIESFPWKFAIRHVVIDIDNYDDNAITSITSADPPLLTSSTHGIPDGYEHGVYIFDTGTDYDYSVFAIDYNDADSFYLYYPDKSTSYDGTAVGAVATGYWRLAPLDEYDYLFTLPSDILRLNRLINPNSGYKREGGYILTNDSFISIEYIAKITTASVYPPAFINAFSDILASRLAVVLTQNPDKIALSLMEQYLKVSLPNAYKVGAIEGDPEDHGEKKDPALLSSWQKAGR